MRVLVAEDEQRVAREIAAGLGSLGFLAEVVHDGEEPGSAAALRLTAPLCWTLACLASTG